jgi:hypothetical protein
MLLSALKEAWGSALRNEHDTNKEMKSHFYNLAIRVLVYKEDDQFVAHALEMDILAYGKTEEAAKRELETLLENQLSFAACKGVPETVHFPAPKEFFDRWEKANQAALKGEPLSEKSFGLHGKPTILVYSQDDLNKLRRKRDFAKTEKLAAA